MNSVAGRYWHTSVLEQLLHTLSCSGFDRHVNRYSPATVPVASQGPARSCRSDLVVAIARSVPPITLYFPLERYYNGLGI